jgi:hypothetical protein
MFLYWSTVVDWTLARRCERPSLRCSNRNPISRALTSEEQDAAGIACQLVVMMLP